MKEGTYIDQLGAIQNRLNRMFEQILAAAGFDEAEGADLPPGGWTPEVDVLETPEAYVLFAELPGLEREDVDLEVRDRRLEISGDRKAVPVTGRFYQMERSHGPFRRVFRLDRTVDAAGIEARMRRGVLEIIVPKAAGGGASRIAVTGEN